MNLLKTLSEKGTLLKIAISIFISAIVLYFLLRNISLQEMADRLQKVNPMLLFGFFAANLSVYALRSFRFNIVFPKIKYFQMFKITSIHALALNILPSRSGEVAFFYLMKKENEPYSRSIAFLLFLRILDVLAILSILLISLLFLKEMPHLIMANFMYLLLATFILCIFLTSLILFSKIYIRIIEGISRILAINKRKLLLKIKEFILGILKTITETPKRDIVILFIISIFIWFMNGIAAYSILLSGADIGFATSAVIFSFMAITLMIPIQGFMGFGTAEGSQYLILAAFNIAPAAAISISLITHMGYLLTSIGLGIVSLIVYKGPTNKENEDGSADIKNIST